MTFDEWKQHVAERYETVTGSPIPQSTAVDRILKAALTKGRTRDEAVAAIITHKPKKKGKG